MIKSKVMPLSHLLASPWYVLIAKLASGDKTLSYYGNGEFVFDRPTEKVKKLHRYEGMVSLIPMGAYLALSYMAHLGTHDFPNAKMEFAFLSALFMVLYVITALAIGEVRLYQPEEYHD